MMVLWGKKKFLLRNGNQTLYGFRYTYSCSKKVCVIHIDVGIKIKQKCRLVSKISQKSAGRRYISKVKGVDK